MKKYKNLYLIIPGMLLMGTAIGLQLEATKEGAIIGLIVGCIVFLILNLKHKRK